MKRIYRNKNKKISVITVVKNGIPYIEEAIKSYKSQNYSNKELIVVYSGTVPNLFSEEQGAVVEGILNDKKYLIADRILAKHDENYMPPQMKKISKENAK